MQSCGLNGFYTSTQLARWHAEIPHRVSCRAYSAPPDAAQRSALEYTCVRVSLPGVRIVLLECEPELLFKSMPFAKRITGATRCAVVITDITVPHASLYAGIGGEAFVLEATYLKLGSCWVSGSFRRTACEIFLQPDEKIAAVIPVGVSASKETHLRRRKSLARLCTSDPVKWPLWAYSTAEAVRFAPSAMNMQPWKLSYAGRSLMISGRSVSALDFGIAMLHMEAAMKDIPHEWRWGTGRNIAILMAEEKE